MPSASPMRGLLLALLARAGGALYVRPAVEVQTVETPAYASAHERLGCSVALLEDVAFVGA